MRLPWRKRKREAAVDPVEAAQREVEISRQRLRETHEKVVKPLKVYSDRNHFAQIIAASLAEGRRGGGAAR